MRKLISHISQPTNIPPDTKFLSSAFFVDRPITKCMQVAAIITPICVRLSELVQQQIYMRCTERKTTPRAAILELGRMNQQRYHTKLLFTRGRPVYKMSFFRIHINVSLLEKVHTSSLTKNSIIKRLNRRKRCIFAWASENIPPF